MTLPVDFKVTELDALNVGAIDLCAQLKRDLFAIAKFLYFKYSQSVPIPGRVYRPILAVVRTADFLLSLNSKCIN